MAITYNERDVARIETGGSIAEAVGGIAVGVLAIVSLAQAAPSTVLISIAAIILGLVIMAEGGTIAAEFYRMMGINVHAGPAVNLETGGMTLEFLAGIGVLVLGILALIGLVPEILIAAAVITAGGTLVLRSGMLIEMSDLRASMGELTDTTRRLARASVSGAVSIQVLCGIAGIVLGLLALTYGMYELRFVDIGMLVMAGAFVFGSGTLTGSLFRMFTH